MLREQSGHARKRKLTAVQKAIGVAADTPWVAVSDDEVARAAAAEARMSAADAERPPLRISAWLWVAAGLDVLAQFARADLLRCAWDLWQEKIRSAAPRGWPSRRRRRGSVLVSRTAC